MKGAIIILLVAAAATAFPSKDVGGYHQQIGIRQAERIRQAEQAVSLHETRIVGGSQAPIGAYPFMAGLVIRLATGGTSVCGGSLLSNTRVLTAAHCWYDGWSQAVEFTVVLGSQYIFIGGVRIPTSDVVMHPNYNTQNYNHDIAIIRMSWVTFTNLIRPITLPTGGLQNESFNGAWAQAAGFGITSDSTGISANQFLSHVTLRVISNEECFTYYPGMVIDSHICTSGVGGVGPCSSDSGGPLSIDVSGQPVLIGVVSFGSGQGCESGRPTAYARVSSYVPWIQAHL